MYTGPVGSMSGCRLDPIWPIIDIQSMSDVPIHSFNVCLNLEWCPHSTKASDVMNQFTAIWLPSISINQSAGHSQLTSFPRAPACLMKKLKLAAIGLGKHQWMKLAAASKISNKCNHWKMLHMLHTHLLKCWFTKGPWLKLPNGNCATFALSLSNSVADIQDWLKHQIETQDDDTHVITCSWWTCFCCWAASRKQCLTSAHWWAEGSSQVHDKGT